MDEKKVLQINLEDILPNRFQPRLRFHEVAINELAESIKKHGVIQPIVVRPIGDKYEIIAGERRYKASTIAGKKTIPVIVADLDDRNSAEVALIENVQREDLTPIEEAVSYKKILDMGYLTQTELANKLGKEQSTVANKLRLLNLHEEVQEALLDEEISERHARSLLKLNKDQQAELLKLIIEKRLTVRKTDQEIDKILNLKEEEPEVINFDLGFEEKEVQIMNENIKNPGFVDIDKIEKEAEDIFVEKEEPKIEEFFNKPAENQQVEELQPRKFFNFFQEEEIEEQINPKVEDVFNFELKEEPKEESVNNKDSMEEETPFNFELKEETKEAEDIFNFEPVEEPKVEEFKFVDFDFDKETSEENIPEIDKNELKETPIQESIVSEIGYDEVKVNTYEPLYDFDELVEEKIEKPVFVEETQNKKDVMKVVSKLRECANNIEREGFVVETEEFDFDDMYQVIIKIIKE